MILEETAQQSPIMSYILIGVLVLMIVLGPVFMKIKNKKEVEKLEQLTSSLKKGNKIITSAGIFGKVVEVKEKDGFKLVTIETGSEKNKSYLTVDVNAIYANLSAKPEDLAVDNVKEKPQEKKDEKEENIVFEEPKFEQTETQNDPVLNQILEDEKVKETKTKKSKNK